MRERPALVSVCFILASACGGAAHEPAAPGAASTGEAASAAKEPSTSEPAGSAAEAKSESASPPAPSADASPVRSAKELLLKPDVLYVFTFNQSEPHDIAEKQCKASAHDDPKKMSECMSKASQKAEQDAVSFQQEGDDKYWWLTVRRKGGALVTLHKIAFDIEKDSDKKVVLKPHGPDKGTKPLGAIPKELVVEVEGESSIAIHDPKLGKLVYEAKLGLMGTKPGQ